MSDKGPVARLLWKGAPWLTVFGLGLSQIRTPVPQMGASWRRTWHPVSLRLLREQPVSTDLLEARWQELISLVEEEFFKHNQHPGGGVFVADRGQLKLRAVLRDGCYYSEAFAPDQVLTGNLRVMTEEFYKSYRAEWDKQ